jgi:dynein regulatory complex subunit 2
MEGAHSTAHRTHLRALDRLIDLQDGRLLTLEGEFKREARALEDEFAAERADLLARHAAFRTELLHVLRAVREAEEAKMATEHAEFEQAREAIRRRNLERIHGLQSDMDAAVDALERAFEEAHVT